MTTRCVWAGEDPLYCEYHDREWGVPIHDDRHLFEPLILEGAQAGLAWITILRKRENYRRAFDGFDPERVARYDEAKIQSLLQDPGIVRNRLKVRAAVTNARAFLDLVEQEGSFDAYLWRLVDGEPIQNAWRRMADVPARTDVSDALARDLKQRGMRFVGPVVCYAHLQAAGLVNDHLVSCFRHREV